jgi:hypothetical protein
MTEPGGKTIPLDNVVRVIEYDEDNVPAPQLEIAAHPKPFCPHEHINIFEYHRKIYCKDCGATLDPFDWILAMGKREGQQFSNLKWLNWELTRKKEEMARLEKEMKNLKALKRRL